MIRQRLLILSAVFVGVAFSVVFQPASAAVAPATSRVGRWLGTADSWRGSTMVLDSAHRHLLVTRANDAVVLDYSGNTVAHLPSLTRPVSQLIGPDNRWWVARQHELDVVDSTNFHLVHRIVVAHHVFLRSFAFATGRVWAQSFNDDNGKSSLASAALSGAPNWSVAMSDIDGSNTLTSAGARASYLYNSTANDVYRLSGVRASRVHYATNGSESYRGSSLDHASSYAVAAPNQVVAQDAVLQSRGTRTTHGIAVLKLSDVSQARAFLPDVCGFDTGLPAISPSSRWVVSGCNNLLTVRDTLDGGDVRAIAFTAPSAYINENAIGSTVVTPDGSTAFFLRFLTDDHGNSAVHFHAYRVALGDW